MEVKNEETKALVNLELQQISSIEQQISSYEDTIMSLESNLTSAQLQLDTLNGVDVKAQKTVAVLTEKGKVNSASYRNMTVGEPVDEYDYEAVGWAVDEGYLIEVPIPDWIEKKY